MAQETLDRIRQAEKQAESLEQAGRREAQELLQKEKAAASAREDALTQQMLRENRERVRAAEQEAESVLRRAEESAAQAIEALRRQAEQNGQAAVEAVLRRLA